MGLEKVGRTSQLRERNSRRSNNCITERVPSPLFRKKWFDSPYRLHNNQTYPASKKPV
jgi:hypothetical protein